VEPDDLLLPDPSDLTEAVTRPQSTRPRLIALVDVWPFGTLDTILLGLLYVAPFAIRWLVSP
jgi:hypothetical protein